MQISESGRHKQVKRSTYITTRFGLPKTGYCHAISGAHHPSNDIYHMKRLGPSQSPLNMRWGVMVGLSQRGGGERPGAPLEWVQRVSRNPSI